MQLTLGTACRITLAAWITVVGCATLATAPRTIAAASSAWYWQNPLPRAYSIGGIACHSVTACVAVGAGGLIVTTDNGGKRWTARTSGTTHDLVSVTCPGRAICYALSGAITGPSPTGRLEGVNSVVLRSVDGGKSWGQRAVSLSDGSNEQLTSLVCPTTRICLASGWLRQSPATAGATGAVLRTTDGGKTWLAWSSPGLQWFADIVCPKVTLCYAAAWINGQSHVVLSSDGGKTWTQQGLRTPRGLTGISCPEAQTCFAITVDCGGECDTGHIYRTTDSARSWKRLSSVRAGGITCPRATTCYESNGTRVLRTTNSGRTWSAHRLRDLAGGMDCPSPTACYAITPVGLLKTSDGFGHTQELLARSAIHNQSLTDISCPSTTVCYAAGGRNVCPPAGPCNDAAASIAATTDGGGTWRATPKTPNLLQRLSCPRVSVCFAIGGSDPGATAVDLSDDGAQTWHQIGWQQISTRLAPNGQASDVTCVAGTTCYLLATVGEYLQGNNVFVQHVAVLVTRNTGQTWSVQTGIDTAARAGGTGTTTNIMPSRISCPSRTTCFVLATVTTASPGNLDQQIVLLSTADGGASWARHLTVPDAVPSNRYSPLGQDLSCPTTTTCYLLSYTQNPEAGNPNGVPGPVLVTHDAGATWHSTVVGNGPYLLTIACAAAQACRVVGPDGIFGTTDGGATWQRQFAEAGMQARMMTSIACADVDACYAVGGVAILATHPRR